ncbi:D-xylose 1-dehydrogenase Gfo6 (plasmid) [Haladaptatus sp. SPP-AMP-3]|uniref:D-xylose 1-dehydrogenase Gfo6 n=1 Tax=Haladaptatus sp. SPP-AMP-3 TaxID=3121295 RepID=UPI003C2F2185
MDLQKYFDAPVSRDWQTMNDGTVRFALVGLGWWTTDFVIPAVADSDLCTVTVAVSGSADKAEHVASDVDTLKAAMTYDEFVDGAATESYDAVYIATPNSRHREYAEAAARHGKAVLCEKPMEATVEDAEAMIDACDDAGVTLMVAYRMHTEPMVRLARRVVADGHIGDPRLVQGMNAQPLLEMNGDLDQWRLDPDLTGYGTSVMDLGIYPLNTARFVLDADPVAVQSMMISKHEAFADVPDERATFAVRYDDGTYAACGTSQNAFDTTSLDIVGTNGNLTLKPAFHMETTLTVTTDDGTYESTAESADQMEEEFDYFANQLLAGEKVYADGRHGLLDMRAIAAIHDAADRGETIRL